MTARSSFYSTVNLNQSIAFDNAMQSHVNGAAVAGALYSGSPPAGVVLTKVTAGVWDVDFPNGGSVRVSHMNAMEKLAGAPIGAWAFTDNSGVNSPQVEISLSTRAIVIHASYANNYAVYTQVAFSEDLGPRCTGLDQSQVFVLGWLAGSEALRQHKCYPQGGDPNPTVSTHIRAWMMTSWWNTTGTWDPVTQAVQKRIAVLHAVRPDGRVFAAGNQVAQWPGQLAIDDRFIIGDEVWRYASYHPTLARTFLIKET